MKLLAFALPLAAAAALSTQTVTLTVVRTYDEPQSSWKLRFSGSVSNGQAGEEVTVMQQRCGTSSSTAVAATQTRESGFWEAEPNYIVIADSATYRARWKSELSEPVVIRPEISVGVRKLRRPGRFQVWVSTGDVQQRMKGRVVVLQRLISGKWTAVRRGRLGYDTVNGFSATFLATFTVPRGWTLRAFVPAKTAAPCFKPNVSERWKS
jgi:hypothetical protein